MGIQIHELTALNRAPQTGDVLAVDTGTTTNKVDYSALRGAVLTDAVRTDDDQNLTDAQKAQAIENIGAATQADVTAIEDEIGNTTLPTTAQTITGAIAEHETDISNINSAIGTVPSGSNLQGEVDDLKSALTPIINKTAENLEYIRGSLKTPAVGQTADHERTAAEAYVSVIAPVSAGDVIIVSAKGGGILGAWCLTDASYRVLSVAGAYETVENKVIVASANGYFISNNNTTYTTNKAIKVGAWFGEIEDTAVFKDQLYYHPNMVNPDEIEMDLRYSNDGWIIIDNSSYAGTGMIPVEEGETYTWSGTAAYAMGGYYAEGSEMKKDEESIANITFLTPVVGDGKCFTVPTGQDIKYVTLVLRKSNGEINGTYQLEKGEMATEIVPYSKLLIKREYLPGGGAEQLASFDSLPVPWYNSEYIKPIENFRNHWAKKDKDLMVVNTGTSLTARGAEHCTSRDDASSRPPLMDSNNFASLMWDKMKWEGQSYRRFDYSGFFTEVGTFKSSESYPITTWDDYGDRDSFTKYCDGSCSVSYTIPDDAWQANFIYRTAPEGTETATISISGGNGKMLVWNGTAWVEANGYTFSMKETAQNLTNVDIPNPLANADNATQHFETFQIAGNTTFQKRVKMKTVSRGEPQTITISSSADRFMYWGVEWSVREFMITYVNVARGGHGITVTSADALQKYQDNDIWSFKPDLIFTENPIHNSGGAGSSVYGFTLYYSNYWQYVTYDFFFNTDNPVSLVSRATANGINAQNLEWIIFNTSIAKNFGGINEDGTLKISPDKNGKMITALDAQMMSQDYITGTGKAVSINACKYWVDAGIKLFGNLYTATTGSGKNGDTFTNEGSHWNDTGCKVMARCIGGVFDFYN